MANEYNIKIEQGATWSVSVNVEQDITGFSAKCQIKQFAYSTNFIVEPTCTVDAANKIITISLTAEQTSSIPTDGTDFSKTKKYVYDLLLFNAEKTYRIINGIVEISPGVTKL